MEELQTALKKYKSIRFKIELTKDFPISFVYSKNKKAPKIYLRDFVLAEDLPILISQIEESIHQKQDYFSTHFRAIIENDVHWFLLCCEFPVEKGFMAIKNNFFYGTMLNVSEYIETSLDDPILSSFRKKNAERLSAGDTDQNKLVEIVDRDYLINIQMPFKLINGIYSAIFDENDTLICTPNPKDTSFDYKRYPYMKRLNIRVNHKLCAYWVIASHKEEAILKNEPLLDILVLTLSRVANSLVLLFNEMVNSERTNKLLSENIEQQILINSVNNIILEQKLTAEAIRSVIKLTGEYINIDNISVFLINEQSDKEGEYTLSHEWVARDNYRLPVKSFVLAQFPIIAKELEHADLYYPMNKSNEFEPFDVKHFVAANLNAEGKRIGLIFYSVFGQCRTPTNQEAKILRSITQILASAIVRYKTDLALDSVNDKLRYLAFNDPVLDVANRAQLDNDLQEELAQRQHGAIIAVKVTNMRVFNELFGHTYADLLLRSVAQYIARMPLDQFTVYRFSGSMLIMLLRECKPLDAKKTAEALLFRFKNPWEQSGNNHYLEASIGVALYPESGATNEEIYRAASLSMYRATEYGTNSYAFYARDFEKPVNVDYYFTQKLRLAINEQMRGFFLKYQPMMDMHTGKIKACEVLVNWQDGQESLPSAKLIKLAESIGYDIEIDRWVIRNAAAFCKRMQDNADPDFAICLNITERDLKSSTIISMVEQALEETGLSAGSVYIEVPEKVLITTQENVLPVVNKLKKTGVNIVVDNFGRDFMSPGLLRYSCIDMIKVDFTVFTNVFDDFDQVLLDTIIRLGGIVKDGICVKRIENQEQLDIVNKYNVDSIQGYHFSQPLNESELIDYITQPHNRKHKVLLTTN